MRELRKELYKTAFHKTAFPKKKSPLLVKLLVHSLGGLCIAALLGAAVCTCRQSQTDKDKISQRPRDSQSDPRPDIVLEGNAFGTSFSIKIFSEESEKKEIELESAQLQNLVQAKLEEIDRTFSNWRKDSEISRFNRHRSKLPFRVSPAFLTVIRSAQRIHQLSRGAFDPAQAELFSLWEEKTLRYAQKGKASPLPDSKEIQKIWRRGGMRFLRILTKSKQIKKLHPQVQLNLSAIAKGYGVDQAAELLEQRGFRSFMVEIGGEVRVAHKKPGKSGGLWRIAIEEPVYIEKPIYTKEPAHIEKPVYSKRTQNHNIQRRVYKIAVLEKKAMASSGNYRNYFITPSGKLYSHIIDPRQAALALESSSPILGTTVIGPSCALADALATSLMVLDLEEGLKMIEKLPNYEALWVLSTAQKGSYKHHLSSGMQSYLE